MNIEVLSYFTMCATYVNNILIYGMLQLLVISNIDFCKKILNYSTIDIKTYKGNIHRNIEHIKHV